MTKFTTPNSSIDVKSSYYDLTVSEYRSILARINETEFVFSVLTGLPIEEVSLYDLSDISPFISFLSEEDPEELEEVDFIEVQAKRKTLVDTSNVYSKQYEQIYFDDTYTKTITDISIREKTWGQKICASNLMTGQIVEEETKTITDVNLDLVQLVAVYVQPIVDGVEFDPEQLFGISEQLDSMPVQTVYPFGIHLKNQLTKILDIETKRLQPTITHDQRKAGIEIFDELGIFNTIDMIAGGNVLNYDPVLKIDYGTIFNKLLLTNKSVIFERNLAEVMKPKV
jgi:hypothetical protein